MSGKTKEQKAIEAEKKALVIAEARRDSIIEKAEKPKTGLIKEISDKITAAKTMDDLEALQKPAYDLWGDDVPVEIQELAFKKGEEIQANSPDPEKVASEGNLQKDWVKVTEAEVKKAEKDGKLAGYDPITQTAKILK